MSLGDGNIEFQAESEPVSSSGLPRKDASRSESQCGHLLVVWPWQVVSGYRVLKTLNEIMSIWKSVSARQRSVLTQHLMKEVARALDLLRNPNLHSNESAGSDVPLEQSQRDSLIREFLKSQKNSFSRTYCIADLLCSMLCGSLDGRGVWGWMDTCICMAETLSIHLKLLQHY